MTCIWLRLKCGFKFIDLKISCSAIFLVDMKNSFSSVDRSLRSGRSNILDFAHRFRSGMVMVSTNRARCGGLGLRPFEALPFLEYSMIRRITGVIEVDYVPGVILHEEK